MHTAQASRTTGTRMLRVHTRRCVLALGIGAAIVALPPALDAAGARVGVHAKPGEIVLLRDVPTRPAVRTAPPALAVLVDTTPNRQIDGALGGMEMSDGEAGAIAAPIRNATGTLHATLASPPTLAGARAGGAPSAPRGAAPTAAPLGTVGNAARGVGTQVTGALQALPFGKPAGG